MRLTACAALLASAAAATTAPGADAAVHLDRAATEGLANDFVDLLAKDDFAAAAKNFDAVMKMVSGPKKLQKAWKSLIARAGPFRQRLRSRLEKSGTFDVVFVTCRFAKANLDVKVVFNPAGKISGLWFVPTRSPVQYTPPQYVRRELFQEKDATVGKGKWALPGTLSVPVAPGPVPGLVLVHGSGPNDRDETVGPNKPFRDLAWGLASRKIAVLRYEKRTRLYAAKLTAQKGGFTVWEETVEDALAAAAMLRKTKGVDARKVFVLGHSLGGMLIPRIAPKGPHIAGFVILAGATRPPERAILEQMTYVYSLDGKIDEIEKAGLQRVKAEVARVKDPKLSPATPGVFLGAPAAYWLDLRGYKPAAEAAKIARPMLILHGRRDYQVTPAEFAEWKKALASRKDVRLKAYPDLNHLFIPGEGKCTPAEYAKPGHVAEEVIADIAEWIHAHPSPPR